MWGNGGAGLPAPQTAPVLRVKLSQENRFFFNQQQGRQNNRVKRHKPAARNRFAAQNLFATQMNFAAVLSAPAGQRNRRKKKNRQDAASSARVARLPPSVGANSKDEEREEKPRKGSETKRLSKTSGAQSVCRSKDICYANEISRLSSARRKKRGSRRCLFY